MSFNVSERRPAPLVQDGELAETTAARAPPPWRIWAWGTLILGALLAVTGCSALRDVRDEIVGVKPALDRCFENRDYVTPSWIPIPHLACRGGTPRYPGREKPEKRSGPPSWLVSQLPPDVIAGVEEAAIPFDWPEP